MKLLSAALRSNPHFLNYCALSFFTLAPVLYYACYSTPSPLALETDISRSFGGSAMDKSRVNSARIAQAFNPTKPPSAAMEAVYGDLLRSGGGKNIVKRHYELTGPLADAQASPAAAAPPLAPAPAPSNPPNPA